MVDDAQVPASLRAELVAVAARTLAGYDPSAVPPALRRVAAFAPAKRATAGAVPLWGALADEHFRSRTARTWAGEHPDLAAALGVAEHDEAVGPEDREDGSGDGEPDGEPARPDDERAGEDAPAPPAAPQPSLAAAAGAWLLGADWRALLPAAAPEARAAGAGAPSDTVARLSDELDRARAERDAALEEVATLRKQARKLRSDADRARAEGRRALEQAAEELAQARAARDEAATALEVAGDERRAADAERTAARAELRVARKLADARVRLLLDTIVDAASGLRTELALPPTTDLPADLVAPPQEAAPARLGSRGRHVDDPGLLDELLRQPRAHLVVDGYNVTKTGYAELTLERQRRLLVDGLAGLATRTGAEVTCCFDGRPTPLAPGTLAHGVRVRFSVGEIADDLIRRLVQAEPVGRVVVVVTSDQEVARDVEARGAYVVPSATLVARLRHS
ncbi:NYN domain-containing protein [Cellulomonas palmilytica]|uniref:NYN domain-containing protein n=1 Tax=Cellulomonas palmilytica TaxID=2608402 RepID=UPI001F2A10D8|nr:NYN domain-containing protein [Cellulomonas palmilytica]UJP39214.1 NYN domain-containing protein [Cellulomonas palmilytica]